MLHRLSLALVLCASVEVLVNGQGNTCRGLDDTCGPQGSRLCCDELQCSANSTEPAQQQLRCSTCDNAVCIGADGLGICCATGFICITGDGCCPVDQTCDTGGPNSQPKCCSTGTTCAVTTTGEAICVDCPASRVCDIIGANGALVKRCCPDGYVCDPVNRQCKLPCPPPLEPCNTPDNCCPENTYCSYTWPPLAPYTDTCCVKTQLCFNPAVNKPFCCPQQTSCINGKCQDCPTGTQFCPLSGTCCKADGSELCVNSECCPKPRVCGNGVKATCCPPGWTCVNGECKEAVPPPCDTTQGLYQCWVNSTYFVCCKDGTDCIPPPLGADPGSACCDPTQTCLDFPGMTTRLCCSQPQQCLNMLWPSPGSVSAEQTCCPPENQCKWLDPSQKPPQPGKDTFCCATICTPFDPTNGSSEKICCPKERYYVGLAADGTKGPLCCPPGQVYQPPANGLQGGCVEVKPPCEDSTPQVCQLGVPPNGTTVCCEEGTCIGGDIGCCKDKVCAVWPGWNPDNVKCCAAPEVCMPPLISTSIGVNQLGATPLCCPPDQQCSALENNGPIKPEFCCTTFCVANYWFNGAPLSVDICCPKDRICGKDCCPPGIPCINGQCCPPKSQCLDPVTGQLTCCKEGKCTPGWPTGNPAVCCGQPGSGTTICISPISFKRTCCPAGYACMSDGTCCPKNKYCFDPVTKRSTCCQDNQFCVNGQCCPDKKGYVCTAWPSLQGQVCCPNGNCLVAWNANPFPGGPVGGSKPPIRTCCPQAQTCQPYIPLVNNANVCCTSACLPPSDGVGGPVCCPKLRSCTAPSADGTVANVCCKEPLVCKKGVCRF